MVSSEMTPADIAAVTGGGNSCNNGGNSSGWGGDWASWIIVFLIFAMFGWGGFGNGFGGGFGGGNAQQGYDTRADLQRGFDNQSVMNKLNGLENGLCDGFYAQNTNMLTGFGNLTLNNAQNTAQIQNSMNQGFNGLNTALITQGYESRLATQGLGAQLADCCCKTQQNIKDNTVQGIMNTNAIQQQISQCCCENEKIAMQNRFDAAQNNCATLQAIDKLGDRLEARFNAAESAAKDRLLAEKDRQILAYQVAQSQAGQTTDIRNGIVSDLRNCPIGTYNVPNPNCCYGPWGAMNWNGFVNNGGGNNCNSCGF